jgi:hypothetical protein
MGCTGRPRSSSWGSLLDRTRQLALAGHDLDQLLHDAIAMRPIDSNVQSIAAVLHSGLGPLAETIEPARPRGPIGSLPDVETPLYHGQLARAAGELIRQRWREIRATLADHHGPLDYARDLGSRPATPADASSWLTAATAITAYRERYELLDHTQMLGDRRGPLRPDAKPPTATPNCRQTGTSPEPSADSRTSSSTSSSSSSTRNSGTRRLRPREAPRRPRHDRRRAAPMDLARPAGPCPTQGTLRTATRDHPPSRRSRRPRRGRPATSPGRNGTPTSDRPCRLRQAPRTQPVGPSSRRC